MYGSLYDNQEAMEKNCFQAGAGLCLLGSPFLGLSLVYVALQSDDEDRFYEELNLDTGDISVGYSLNVHKEKLIDYHFQQGTLYGSESDPLHDYLADDYIYERDMLAEIYEFPVSAIISNNFYLIPSDQRYFLYFQDMLRLYLRDRQLSRTEDYFLHKFMGELGRGYPSSLLGTYPAVKPQTMHSWPWALNRTVHRTRAPKERSKRHFLGSLNYLDLSLDRINFYKDQLKYNHALV